jgi:uncharacterized protein (DUF58 family)
VALAGVAFALAWEVVGDVVLRIAIAGVVSVVVFDVVLARRTPALEVRRHLPHNLPVNRSTEVALVIGNPGDASVTGVLFEHYPDGVEVEGLPAVVALAPGTSLTVAYRVRPLERGDLEIASSELLLRSPLGLWERKHRIGEQQSVRVYPDFAVIARYLALVTDQHAVRLGIKLVQKRGEGLEFHQLREYRTGDALRQIDWKATSRRRELISREYEEERDQHVVFVIDSGRRMRSRDGALSHFDHALNATLLLAYVALRQGDDVSALAFGARRQWVPRLSGVGSINQLLNAVYDLHSGPYASDYVAAAEDVMSRQRKRALVVLMTNLREDEDDLAPALRLMRRRHLVVVANLREPVLDETMGQEIIEFDDALRVAGTAHYLARRADTHKALGRDAHLLIDTVPAELPVRVVNAYWQVKRAGAL